MSNNELKWTRVQAGEYRADIRDEEGNTILVYSAWSSYSWAFREDHWFLDVWHEQSRKRMRIGVQHRRYKDAKIAAARHFALTLKEAQNRETP